MAQAIRGSFLIVAGVSLLAACGDSSGPSGESGTLSFTYSGGVSGSYTASGGLPASQAQFNTTTWSAGYKDVPNQTLQLQSVAARTGGRFDLVALTIDRIVPGNSTVDINCDPTIANGCAGFAVFFGVSNTTGDAQFLCGFQTGQLTITSITDTRAQGSFSGSGFCLDENLVESAFTASAGAFDVALVAHLPT